MADTAKQKTIEQLNQNFAYITARANGQEGRPGVYFQELTYENQKDENGNDVLVDGEPVPVATGWDEAATNAAYQEWLAANPADANTAGEGEGGEVEENGGAA